MKRLLPASLLALSLLPTGSIADDQDVIDYRKHIMDTLQAQVAFKLAKPASQSPTVLYLATATFATGTILTVDGGLTAA